MWANVQVKAASDVREDKESPKNCSYLKSCESPYTCPHAPFWSVRNVVPTLTSNKRQGLSLNGRCQAIRNTRFILVPVEGRTCSSGVLEALYCSALGVPVVGLLQARRERKCGFQVPGEVAEDVVGELESECVVCRTLSAGVPCRSLLCPLRRGSSPSFYRPRRERITCMPHYSATWGSVVRRTVE
jgi:hypothetical protein